MMTLFLFIILSWQTKRGLVVPATPCTPCTVIAAVAVAVVAVATCAIHLAVATCTIHLAVAVLACAWNVQGCFRRFFVPSTSIQRIININPFLHGF